jgi:hypothetical protein
VSGLPNGRSRNSSSSTHQEIGEHHGNPEEDIERQEVDLNQEHQQDQICSSAFAQAQDGHEGNAVGNRQLFA